VSEEGKISLNFKQSQAVRYEKGPLLVVAGPGTGKTRVITERIRYLISEKGVDPQSILALTFTEKAAAEMLSRIDEVMPLGYEEPWLSTFHSFCDRVLRLSGLEIGLDPSFNIMTSAEQWIFVREHLFSLDLSYFRPLGNPSKFISALITLFSRLQDEDVSPNEFLQFVNARKDKMGSLDLDSVLAEELAKLRELASAYARYEELKLRESQMDFGDLISWTLRLFRDRPAVLAKYRNQFQYILIDEFQDTNYAQYQLIRLLAPAEKNPHLLVVGDDSQAIYKFRGASLSNILNFREDYPQAKTIVLNLDYRNPQRIIKSFSSLSRKNEPNTLESKLGINKSLRAARKNSTVKEDVMEVLAAATGEEEAEAVVEKIIALSKDGGYTWKDFAILARAHSYLDPFVAALRRAAIPYQLLGNRGLFDQPEIRELISFLRVVSDLEQGPALFELLSSPTFNISSTDVVGFLSQARRTHQPLWEIVSSSRDSSAELAVLVKAIEHARRNLLREPPSRLLYNFVMESGLVRRFLDGESLENQLRVKNLNLFFEKIKEFESRVDKATIPDFVNYLDLLIEAGENPAQAEIEDVDTVNLLTVHSAKGLEFPVVFMVNLVVGRFPSRRRGELLEIPQELIKDILPEGDIHLQEERRLFYVGCSRASERLFLTWAKNYGGKSERRPSAFIEELGLDATAGGESPATANQLKLPVIADSYEVTRHLPQVSYEPDFVSYTQLETFKQCPLRYKYRYVLGIPVLPHHTLSFGQTIHRTLRDFHRADLFGKKDLDYLLGLYEKHWIDEGYTSKKHKEERFASGRELLKEYYKRYPETLHKPLFLEKKFTLKFGSTSLVGSIDRIDELEDGVEVVDYKTGKPADQRAVDKDDQLTIYALATRDALGLDPQSLALYFVGTNEKVTTTRSPEELDQMREEIKRLIEAIKTSKFEPAFNKHLCDHCDYRYICPAYKVGS